MPGMDLSFGLSDDQLALREMVRKLAADRYAPHAREWDRERRPLDLKERKHLASLGLLGITMPAEYGGEGRPLIDALIVLEELAKASPIAAWPAFEANTGPPGSSSSSEPRSRRRGSCRPVVAGRRDYRGLHLRADAGSAATDLTTRGRIDGDTVVVNGVKRWCSGAGHSEQYLVYLRLSEARGAKGIGAVIVGKDSPGRDLRPAGGPDGLSRYLLRRHDARRGAECH